MGNNNRQCSDKPGKSDLGDFHRNRLVFLNCPGSIPAHDIHTLVTVLNLVHKNKDFSIIFRI